jgi:fused signal recognition particle receptor
MSNIFNKWKDGLAKTSKAKFGQIASLFGATEITDDTFEELEALLVQADLGIETSESILEALWENFADAFPYHLQSPFLPNPP